MTVWDDAAVHVIQVTGEFDSRGCSEFRHGAMREDAELVVVDLRRATFIDSRALGELIALQRETTRADAQLAILRPAGWADRIFKLTGMDGALPLYDENVPVLAQFNYG